MAEILAWEQRMAAHFAKGGNIPMYGSERFMQEEIAEWRAAFSGRESGVARDAPTCWIDPIELRELENGTVAMVVPVQGNADRIPLFRRAP